LAERKGQSDFAIWPLGFKEAGDDLIALSAKTETDKNIVLQFLAQQGMQSPDEIEIGVIRVADTQANEYGAPARAPHRYIVDQQITGRTARVHQVVVASQKTKRLQKGVVLGGNPGQGVSYKCNGPKAIKPDMITEATRNAVQYYLDK
jgi:uncharacterized protein